MAGGDEDVPRIDNVTEPIRSVEPISKKKMRMSAERNERRTTNADTHNQTYNLRLDRLCPYSGRRGVGGFDVVERGRRPRIRRRARTRRAALVTEWQDVILYQVDAATPTTWECQHGHHGSAERRTLADNGWRSMWTGACAGTVYSVMHARETDCGCSCHAGIDG